MLDGLGVAPKAASPIGGRWWLWLLPLLAIGGVAWLWLASQSIPSLPSLAWARPAAGASAAMADPDRVPGPARSPADAAPPPTALPLLPAAPAAVVAAASAAAVIERPAAPDGTASAGEGLAAHADAPAPPPAVRPALRLPAAAAAVAPASAPALAPTLAPTRPGRLPQAEAPPRTPVVPRPAGPPPAEDPDVDLVAALMAHVPPAAAAPRRAGPPPEEGRVAPAPAAGRVAAAAAPRGAAVGSGRAGTLDQRVQRCKVQATLAQSRACRRRVCEAHWGTHPACPLRLKAPASPKLVARGASAPGRAATPS